MLPAAGRPLHQAGARFLDALHRHPVLGAVLLAAGAMAAVLLTLNPHFETNDDMGIRWLADGTFTGRPEADLIASNVVLGLVLRGLYRAAGGFPWYGAYLYALHFASLAALAYAVLSGSRERLGARLLLCGGVLGVFHVPMWLDLQFTSTAMLLGATGVVLFRSVADRGRVPAAAVVLAGAMVGVAWWVRWKAAAAVVLIAVPILAPALRRANWRRFAAFGAAALVVVSAGWATETAYYHGRADWQAFFDFNDVRLQLHQTRRLEETDPAVLAAVGWTRNDLLMFENWFYADPAVYETADLEVIFAAAPRPFEPGVAAGLLREQAAGWLGGARIALLAGLACLAAAPRERRTRLAVAAAALGVGGIAFVLAATTKLPDRVALPLLAALAVYFLAAVGDPGPPGGSRPPAHCAWWWAAGAVAAGALAVGVGHALAADRANDRQEDIRRNVLADIQRLDPDGVFVAWGVELPRWPDPLAAHPSTEAAGLQVIPLGWMQRSPVVDRVFARYGISDIYAAIAGGQVYLPLQFPDTAGLFTTYLREHYGFSGLLTPVARVRPLTIFRGAAAYTLDAAAGLLRVSPFAGEAAAFPLAEPLERRATVKVNEAGRPVVEGRADAELIVAFDGPAAVALGLPQPGDGGLPHYRIVLPAPPSDLRLFAVGGGVAREITPRAATG